MSVFYIGQWVQRVPTWINPEGRKESGVYARHPELAPVPQMATVVAVNPKRRTYTLRYDKTGLLETMKG